MSEREDWVALLEAMYFAGYRLHDSLDDVDPGYEYAVQQLCSEMSLFIGGVDEDMSVRAMQAAQDRKYGESRGEDSRSLGEFGVVRDE